MRRAAPALGLGLAVAAALAGDILVQPVSVSAPGEADGSFKHTIDGSGLSFPLAKGAPAPASVLDLPAHETGGRGANQRIQDVSGRFKDGSGGSTVFDLGRDCDVTGLVIWNYSEWWQGEFLNHRAIRTAVVEAAPTTTGVFRRVQTLSLPQPPDSDWIEPVIIAFTNAPVRARAIRLSDLRSHGNREFHGFGEIRVRVRSSR